jgi:curved DNA-binding protein CbpA
MAKQPSSNQQPPTIDAQIIEKKTSEEQAVKPPPLPQTNNPFTLLGLSVAASFDAIRRAYKEKVKVYHPDIVVGPDASPEERKEANWDFARINAAYDILKRRENEEVYEYEMFVDGKRVTKTVYVDEEQRHYKRDAHYIDYDRIRQVAEYRKTRPKKKMWYEEEHHYQPTNKGFEKDASYCSNEKWYNHLETFEYEQDMGCPPYNGFISTQETMRRNGFVVGHQPGRQVEEKFWHNRHTFEAANNRNRWWDEDNSRYTRFDEEEWNSFATSNDRWNRKVADDEFGTCNGYDNYESAQYDPTDTWYKQFNDEPKFNGNFGP